MTPRRTPARLRALTSLVATAAVAAATASLTFAAPAAAAEVSAPVSAGVDARGGLQVDSISCVRTTEPGDFGTLTISGVVLKQPVGRQTMTLDVRDRATTTPLYSQPVTADPATREFTVTLEADGLRRIRQLDLQLTRVAPTTGAAVVGLVKTAGVCGWADWSRLPVPTITEIAFREEGPSYRSVFTVSNTTEFAAPLNIHYAVCDDDATGEGCLMAVTYWRTVVPPLTSDHTTESPVSFGELDFYRVTTGIGGSPRGHLEGQPYDHMGGTYTGSFDD